MQIVRKKLSASEITPPNVRYDAECDCVQSTYDGGETWVDNPGADPRISPAFRAPANATADPQCNAAAGMVALLRSLIDVDLAATTALGLTSTWFGILFLVFPIGIIADILLLIADVILGIGSAAIAASFTEEVYDGLLCVFYNNIDADGQMSDAQLADIYATIAAQFDLTVQAVFGAHSSGIGPVGWSNAGALGSETGDCTGCACPGCYEWNFATDAQGFEVCSLASYSMGAWHQVCTGGGGSAATMNIGQGFGAVALPGVSHVEMDLSFDGAGNPTDWQILGLATDTGTCGGGQVTLASGTISASGTVSADISETDVYGFQLITSTDGGCGSSDVSLTAFRITSTNLCAIGLEPNC